MAEFKRNVFEKIDKNIGHDTLMRIIANIPSNIFFKDTESKYRLMTHIWGEIKDENVIGKTDLEVRKDVENVKQAMESDREILRTGKGTDYVIKSDIDGKVSYLQLIKEPIYDDNGEPLGIVALINDVTEKTIIEQKLREASKELKEQCDELEASNAELLNTLEKIKQMNEERKLLTASMNHELRSPLNGIIGNLQVLLNDSKLDEEQLKGVTNAYQSSIHMLDIVNDLLEHAKMDSNEFRIRKALFEMDDVISNINQNAITLANQKGLRFELEDETVAGKQFVGDETRIKQIMFNLVSNAIKYTSEGKVLFNVAYHGEKLLIKCSDTGQGISKENQKTLFDPYTRFEENKNKNIQGTGLGLSVVKRIVEKMNGTIEVDSEVDKGTVFTVVIPIQLCNEKVITDNPIEKMKSKRDADYKGLSILCVDDTRTNVIVFGGLLKDFDIKIDAAYSGQEAIDLAKNTKYDIIFMDHQMPQMSGEEALNIIKEECEINKDTPIIAFTGNAGPDADEKYKNMGFDGYLVKPVFKEQLMEIIDSFLA